METHCLHASVRIPKILPHPLLHRLLRQNQKTQPQALLRLLPKKRQKQDRAAKIKIDRTGQDKITGRPEQASLKEAVTGLHAHKVKPVLIGLHVHKVKAVLIGHLAHKVKAGSSVHNKVKAKVDSTGLLAHSKGKVDSIGQGLIKADSAHNKDNKAKADTTGQGRRVQVAAPVDSTAKGQGARDEADLIHRPQKKIKKQNQPRTISARSGTKAKLQIKLKKTKKKMNAKKTAKVLTAGEAGRASPLKKSCPLRLCPWLSKLPLLQKLRCAT